MLIDLGKINTQEFNDRLYDVCICGAGPAGITIARKLAEQGRLVALMEGGGSDPSSFSQQLYGGESRGISYPITASRLRYFGGTSNHWGGETRPLDSRDFNSLSHHQFNEWPISKRDLDIYAEEVNNILDLVNPTIKSDVFEGKAPELPLVQPGFRMSSPVTRFGLKYGKEIEQSPLIDLYLNANLVDISLNKDHSNVSGFVFRSGAKPENFFVRAQHFVLCCGGLENPRALLLSDSQVPGGIGNQNDMVGRHFCEHTTTEVGRAIMKAHHTSPGYNICSDRLMHDKKCLSFLVEFGFPVLDSGGSFLNRVFDAVFKKSKSEPQTAVYIVVQQACNPDSRVTLTNEKDGLGLRRLALNWQLTALDRHTVRTAATEIARNLALQDVGRMKVSPFVLDKSVDIPVSYMNHHMCTTRMSDTSTTGVVDRNCRVFGLENLFIGGSSVFASAGVSNPTYTIVQLALRLGDHLDELLS